MTLDIQCQVEVDSYSYEPQGDRIYDVKLVIRDPAFNFEAAVDFDKLRLGEQKEVIRRIRERRAKQFDQP